ncbi:three-Cys-motif partner protein TcmP [Roseiflexus castenholzii]|jgi:three-Cys-motif partner protein|uniref:Three-Cys-motif partner protein TcmP n=1 Tax=Roseiflexus castenholzii (strain DSM 13941 / HLO8) TaxID=383372 RepID=A7NG71_ROSCS|nr:three-Cys-motif partner protein TcmP [Roseiflexus castenholzii]ABU56458.1 conserved hypothetical protein [Roseiflexus castenholzii DSM 13941]
MTTHTFGGDWTDDKLERLRKYLAAYTTIFNKNERARKLKTIYVDAFAGTGYRDRKTQPNDQLPLFPELEQPEAAAFLDGSARIALGVEPPFKQYLLIERDSKREQALQQLKRDFPDKQIKIVKEDANNYLTQWCAEQDWRYSRAVVFLDPYGMQVSWGLIEALARTKAIDLWFLFPLGVAVNRLLTRKAPPTGAWADALTRILGTDAWKSAFYVQKNQLTLFGEEESCEKEADFERIGRFFVERLKTVFYGVAENPLPLRNSRHNPLYLLCFASGNPKGSQTAIKIAQHILST